MRIAVCRVTLDRWMGFGLGLALSLLTIAPTAATSTSRQESPTERLMRSKRAASHELLDGVVLQDFERLSREAFRLRALAETADWNVLETEAYARHSRSFVEATQELVLAAQAKDGSRAALAYVEMTLRCVSCHRYVESQLPRSEPEPE